MVLLPGSSPGPLAGRAPIASPLVHRCRPTSWGLASSQRRDDLGWSPKLALAILMTYVETTTMASSHPQRIGNGSGGSACPRWPSGPRPWPSPSQHAAVAWRLGQGISCLSPFVIALNPWWWRQLSGFCSVSRKLSLTEEDLVDVIKLQS